MPSCVWPSAPERMAAAAAAMQWAAAAAGRTEAGLPAAAAGLPHPAPIAAPKAVHSRQRAAAHWPGHGRRCDPGTAGLSSQSSRPLLVNTAGHDAWQARLCQMVDCQE